MWTRLRPGIEKKERRLRHEQVYRQMEQAIWKHALPSIPPSQHSLNDTLEGLRHMHEKNLACLIEAAAAQPAQQTTACPPVGAENHSIPNGMVTRPTST